MNVNRTHFEILRTHQPTAYDNGIYKVPGPDGGKMKIKTNGTVEVHYLNDPAGTYRSISVNGTNAWDMPDVIDEIKEAGTTVPLTDILIGKGR